MVDFSVMKKPISWGVVLLSVASLAACGSSDADSNPSLDGIWQVTTPSGCVETFEFNGTNYSVNVLCLLNNGNFGVDIDSGSFTAANGDIDFSPKKSSCPSELLKATVPYTLEGNNQLLITLGAAQLILGRMQPSTVSGGATIEDGCWDFSQSPAAFTPNPIQQL